MITDAALRLGTDQAITVSANTTNTIDLSQNRDIGEGKQMHMVFTVTTTGTSTNTVTFSVITSAAAALTSATTLVTSDAITATNLVAVVGQTGGTQIILPIPARSYSAPQRYLGGYFTCSGTVGALTVTTDIVDNVAAARQTYASGFSIT